MKKILIIEDDPLLGDLLMQKLQTSGYECHLERDGIAGYAKIGEWNPDLIILDIFLPSLNGLDILGQKKADAKISAIPVIVLSNSLRPTSLSVMENLGATDFMVKADVTEGAIVERIKRVFDGISGGSGGTAVSEGTKSASVLSDGPTPRGHAMLDGKKVLLVEDDSFLGGIMMTRLRARKADAVYTISGEGALEEFKKQKFDIVLLDLLLPGIGGFEVLKSIRENSENKEVPVIIISNFDQLKDRDMAKSMNAGYLVKALVNPDEIIDHAVALL